MLELLVVQSCPIVIGGDLNIHVEDPDDVNARRLHELLTSCGMQQHVNSPTHRCGGTLDLLITVSDQPLDQVSVDPAGILSDHALITCHIPVTLGQDEVAERLVRDWRRADRDVLRRALLDSPLCQPPPDTANVDELLAVYDDVLRDIADRVAPQHSMRRHTMHLAPWFDDRCRQARRECRRLERRYRRTETPDDRLKWIEAVRRRFQEYRFGRLSQHGRSSAPLWRSLSSILGRNRDVVAPNDFTVDDFVTFFTSKVDAIRAATADKAAPPPEAGAVKCFLSTFRLLTQADYDVTNQVVCARSGSDGSTTRVRRPIASVCNSHGELITA